MKAAPQGERKGTDPAAPAEVVTDANPVVASLKRHAAKGMLLFTRLVGMTGIAWLVAYGIWQQGLSAGLVCLLLCRRVSPTDIGLCASAVAKAKVGKGPLQSQSYLAQ